MHTNCECTISGLLSEQEIERVNQLVHDNGGEAVKGSMLGKIEHFSPRSGCPHQHRLDEETGYCSCEAFLKDWTAELGETAGLKGGRPL